MRPLKDFEFYIKKGTIRKVSVDEYKAKSLVEDSTNKRDFLSKIMKKMSVDEINANFVVEQMYDIVRGVTCEYRSLGATYYPPAAKIAINPIMFRGHLHRGEKRDIMSTIEYNYFGGEEHNPSLLIPEAKYNADSYLREHAHKRMEREQITQESLVGLEAAQKAQMLQEWMVQRKLQL